MNEPYGAESDMLNRWPFLNVFKASRQAFQPGRLVLAAMGLLCSILFGTVLDFVWLTSGGGLTGEELSASPLIARVPVMPAEPPVVEAEDDDATGAEDGEDETTPPPARREPKVGIFSSLRQHSVHCVSQSLTAARKLQLTGHMGHVRSQLNRRGGQDLRLNVSEGYGVAAFLIAGGNGVFWVLRNHWFFSLVLFTGLLIIWSLFGGAICRLATMRFASGEHVPLGDAFRFARERLANFVLGPASVLGVILVLGLCLTVGAFIVNYTWVIGSVAGSVLFGGALMVGTLIGVVAFGLLGSIHLMWPTIAVEGSDFLDAMSRSFSYFLQAIERTIGYALIALIYGSFIWLIVRFVALLILWMTHGFLEIGNSDMNGMWATPSYDALFVQPETASGVGTLLPFAVKVWVKLFILFLHGYLISYYLTASTIIYHLLRRAVDDTELDDVYIESDEDAKPAAVTAAPAPAADDSASTSGGAS